jgi:hypothetical protein
VNYALTGVPSYFGGNGSYGIVWGSNKDKLSSISDILIVAQGATAGYGPGQFFG